MRPPLFVGAAVDIGFGPVWTGTATGICAGIAVLGAGALVAEATALADTEATALAAVELGCAVTESAAPGETTGPADVVVAAAVGAALSAACVVLGVRNAKK